MRYSRRDVLKLGAGAGAALVFGRDVLARPALYRQQQLLKTIPSSGEKIPAVGLGSAASFQSAARNPAEHADLKEVLRLFTELGGAVVDTSPSYGQSEQVIGQLVRDIGNGDRIFLATKISGAQGRDEGVQQVNRSIERLQPMNIDLNQVHNLGDTATQLAVLREMKQAGKIRYIGVTTSSDRQYPQLEQILRSEQLDFVQFDYAVDNRNVEQTILPIARDRGVATLVNGPFGRTRLFQRAGDRPVPDWAKEFGANTWAQFFLKWLLGNPAITVVIPATSDPAHLRDNMGAGLGRLPDEAERKRMAEFVDALPAAPGRRGGGG
jgi:aryl-alcohol dehydrogenase-like predicted oxidoreductase